jgi:CheY-like chemotaxis protein
MEGAMHRLLVFDDGRGTGRRCAGALVSDGYEVLMAANGREALEMVDTWKPEAVVLDLLSPRANGRSELDACAVFVWVLAQDRGIPVVVCTRAPEHLKALRSWEADAHVLLKRRTKALRAALAHLLPGRAEVAAVGA